jgi:hypothetical protein
MALTMEHRPIRPSPSIGLGPVHHDQLGIKIAIATRAGKMKSLRHHHRHQNKLSVPNDGIPSYPTKVNRMTRRDSTF